MKCGRNVFVNPPTAEVTVYAPGKFDPSAARTGQPVDVNGRGGFFGAAQRGFPTVDPSGFFDSMLLTWQYAENAWATVRGMTTTTSEHDRMLELARALRPTERTPVRAPLSLANVPARMPLVSVETSYLPINGPSSDYGTTLDFSPCVTLTKAQDCMEKGKQTGSIGVRIWHRDGYDEDRSRYHEEEVARKIGGKDGRFDRSVCWAAVQVQKGMYVEFTCSSQRGTVLTKEFDDVLNSVVWAPDPGNDATWRPVSDWAK
jgi:hypothetical protein